MPIRYQRPSGLICLFFTLLLQFPILLGLMASAQQQKLVSYKPAEERTQPEGCWIVANKPLGKLPAAVY